MKSFKHIHECTPTESTEKLTYSVLDNVMLKTWNSPDHSGIQTCITHSVNPGEQESVCEGVWVGENLEAASEISRGKQWTHWPAS